MVQSHSLKFKELPLKLALYLIVSFVFFCPLLWASQDAMVIADKAIIFSDRNMTSAVGYIRRGKKIVVGEVARNKAQVYPIVVSGKIAYIRVVDVTTEKESMHSTRLVAERFQRTTHTDLKSKFVLSYYTYSSSINLAAQNDKLADGDSLTWHGLSLKGEVLIKRVFDLQMIANFMSGTQEEETFRAFEVGFGGAYRIIDRKNFIMRLGAQFLAIPFSTYSLGEKFRVKGYGYTMGAGVDMTYLFNGHWGLEGYGGLYRSKIMGFSAPLPYQEISPSFIGPRIGVGVNYTY
jgi:hypothetical protein